MLEGLLTAASDSLEFICVQPRKMTCRAVCLPLLSDSLCA